MTACADPSFPLKNSSKRRRIDVPLSSRACKLMRSAFSMSRSLVSRVVLRFFLHRVFAFVVALGFVAPHVALHRVLFAPWKSCLDASSVSVGVREESRCCHLSDGLGRPKRRRSHRNAVSMQRMKFMRPVDRTGRMVPAWSRGDGAKQPACGRRLRQTCSSPACLLWLRDEDPTVAVPSFDHVVAGCG